MHDGVFRLQLRTYIVKSVIAGGGHVSAVFTEDVTTVLLSDSTPTQ